MFPEPSNRLGAVLMSLLMFTAGALAAPKPSDPAALFATDRVLEVQVTLAPADWQKLCLQERDLKVELGRERLERPAPSPYTWFSAEVVIDGQRFQNVGVRKRGFFGSSDTNRPSLNVELDKYVKGQKVAGRSELKLHNNKQDGTGLRQVLAYKLFAAAGVPAPHCGLAHVTVNGTDLGLYSSLEAIDDAFLKRQFGSDSGNLYEAVISDFRPGWTKTFEKKNNKTASRGDLDAVAAALEVDDAQLLDRLGRVLDVKAFINFWAMESLINHWDGFAGDLNNTFVYHDPGSDKLRFVAWGADSTFGPHNLFVPFEPPASVWAVSLLTRRLYNHPVTRDQYRARLQELLATVWNEKALLAETDRLTELTKGLSKVPAFQAGMEGQQLRQFIKERRGVLEAELKQPAVAWTYPQRKEPYTTVIGKVSATFSTATVPSAFMPAPGGAKAHVELQFPNHRYVGDFADAKAMPDMLVPGNAAIALTGSFKGVEVPVALWFSAPTNQFNAGTTLKAGGKEGIVLLVAGQPGKSDFRILGSWETGSMKLAQAGMAAGTKVEGSLEAEVSSSPWEDMDLAQLKKAP